MKIHILGICGTFMGGVALLARQMGHQVKGSDENIYPPMSDALQAAGIEVLQGYEPKDLSYQPDCEIIGNAMSRGNTCVETILNKNIEYISAPEWLAQQVLAKRHVLAVAGTHGKTTTASILAWILTSAGLNPGYLIGGVANNFNHTAELGEDPFFVIEADEYDSAFFDKRSKFIHYRPRTLILNNLEYDHADIFDDLEAIKLQFHYLLRTVPSSGLIIFPEEEKELEDVISRGCWTSIQKVGKKQGIWQAHNVSDDGSYFELWHRDQKLGVVEWQMCGLHNIQNALTAVAAAFEAGVTSEKLLAGLKTFQGVKRRMEVCGQVNGITLYDDFAHHPTAITTTLSGLRAKVGRERIIAVVQFGSYTMRTGVHRSVIAEALRDADIVLMLQPEIKNKEVNDWDLTHVINELGSRGKIFEDISLIIDYLIKELRSNDHVLIMSNKGFGGIHHQLLAKLQNASVENYSEIGKS